MAAFGADGRCLMRALQEELDDPEPADCGRCAVCAGAALRRRRSTRRSCARPRCTCARSRSLLEVKKMAPSRGRRDAQDPRGRARRGGPRAGAARRRRLGPARPGRAPRGALRRRARRRRRRGGARLGRAGRVGDRRAVAPQRRRSCPTFARAARGARSGSRTRPRSSAPTTGRRSARWRNSAQQVANVRGAVRGRRRRCPAGPCLLVDDVRFSGWTLAMIGRAAAPARRRGRSTRSRWPPRSDARRAGAAREQQPRDRPGSSLIGTCPQPCSQTCRARGQQPARAQRLGREQQRVARAPADRHRHADARPRSGARRAR